MMNLCVEVKIKGHIVPFDWNFGMCSLALQVYRLLARLVNEEWLVCRDVKSNSDPLSVMLCQERDTLSREHSIS